MKIFIKGVKVLFVTLLAILVLLNLWQLVSLVIFNQDLPESAGYSHLAVLSGSMEPAISAGDLIIIHRQEEYETGDIITFEDQGVFTTHRIIEADAGTYLTRGDANNVADSYPITMKQVRGRVVLVIPELGRLLLLLRTPLGILCVLLLGALPFLWAEWIKCRGDKCDP